MADRRTKIVLASAVMVCAVGGSLMFLRPGRSQQSTVTEVAPAPTPPVPLRYRIDPPAAAPEVSHLLGRIEPEAAAAPVGRQPHAPPLKTATKRQEYEVGELPPPSSARQSIASLTPRRDPAAMPQADWSPLHMDREARPLIHRVLEGETLSGLARRYLGSSDRWAELFAANRQVLGDPNHLRVGMELVIPPGPGGNQYPATGAYQPSSAAQATTPAAMVPIDAEGWRRSRQQPAPRSYRVRAEDTLVDIAKQFYGDGSKFLDVFQANRDQLSSPDQLREGLLLVIP